MAQRAGGVRAIVSWRSPSARRLGLDPENAPDEGLLELMAGEPRLIRRPIVAAHGTIVVGAGPKELEAAFGGR